jgi:hypothetical protein
MKKQGIVSKTQGNQNKKRLLVSICHVATPDAHTRLYRATDILLQAAARGPTKPKDSINSEKGPAEVSD